MTTSAPDSSLRNSSLQRQGWHETGSFALVAGLAGIVLALAIAVRHTQGLAFYFLLLLGFAIAAVCYKKRPKLFEVIGLGLGLANVTFSIMMIAYTNYGEGAFWFALFGAGGSCLAILGWHMRNVADHYPRT